MMLNVEQYEALSEIKSMDELRAYIIETEEDPETIGILYNMNCIRDLESFLEEVAQDYIDNRVCLVCGGTVLYGSMGGYVLDGICTCCGTIYKLD